MAGPRSTARLDPPPPARAHGVSGHLRAGVRRGFGRRAVGRWSREAWPAVGGGEVQRELGFVDRRVGAGRGRTGADRSRSEMGVSPAWGGLGVGVTASSFHARRCSSVRRTLRSAAGATGCWASKSPCKPACPSASSRCSAMHPPGLHRPGGWGSGWADGQPGIGFRSDLREACRCVVLPPWDVVNPSGIGVHVGRWSYRGIVRERRAGPLGKQQIDDR